MLVLIDRIQITLKNNAGSHFVDHFFSFLPAYTGIDQYLVGFFGGKSLRPFYDGQRKSLIQKPGIAIHFFTLNAFRSINP